MSTLTPHGLLEGLSWLSDLPSAPRLDPKSPEGQARLRRLSEELQRVAPSDEEFAAACQGLARRAGAWYPTPGQLAELVVELRLERAREEREDQWRAQRAASAAPLLGEGSDLGRFVRGSMVGFRHRDQGQFFSSIVDLLRRGHPGPGPGQEETLVAAVLREEREEDAARAAGQEWRRPRYGPSQLAGGMGWGLAERGLR